MIRYKKMLFIILCFLSGFIFFIAYHYSKEQIVYNEKCTANWIIFNDQGRANLTIDFMYNKNKKTGTVALSGTWKQNTNTYKSFRRDIEYTWIENYDTLHLTSTKINKFDIIDQISDDNLAQLLPDFYIFPGKMISYNVQKQNNHDFLLSIGHRAIMYCAR
ncbi:hypothetical protein [Escherichia sp. E4742]|uniref:hypothetical protein n=1 Tax=Escherichia sp. E4742 TaxID=2044467 RepID=UPI0010FCF310|nr:hypothetical protein [Escherichia sp. E4742]QCT86486.1 hypothetical protein FEM44_04175 [Escherichia sp. E4742]TLJ05718.1 hypothetical protein FEK62_04175 [Escherichia sp. E4742]